MKKIKIVLLRGPSAVGKTTIAQDLLLALKDRRIDCAFISEDTFRKKMQFKYKAEDKETHLNSVELIKSVIERLTELDHYESIIIEGLFRYEEMIANYRRFANQKGYGLFVFQLQAPLNVRQKRNKLSKTRDHVVDLNSPHGQGKGEEIKIKEALVLDTTKSLKETTKTIISKLKL